MGDEGRTRGSAKGGAGLSAIQILQGEDISTAQPMSRCFSAPLPLTLADGRHTAVERAYRRLGVHVSRTLLCSLEPGINTYGQQRHERLRCCFLGF